ncbi:ferredoxin [Rhodococcus sp. NPDC003382]|uniref:ferredoxin n=1 Tax=unclassified Rhodococcus (in: high G+C Gram-positive bacteria) TaxID=192944 RepID=UPI00200AEB10|nr:MULTISPECIES: ferredoxin [unclassified Rhodococcus (in: high G+C Gram-positive bacteria)]MCK8672995.1 ferredoxin [Rhodococcus sp. HM1]
MSDTRQQTRQLVVDRSACAGHGLCYSTSPQLIDCDDQGYPVLLKEFLSDDDVPAAEAAAVVCPERALTIESR